MKDLAVVTIDYQLDYFPGGRFPLWGAERAIRRASAVLEWARIRKLPIIHVRHESTGPGAKFLAEGTPGTALHPMLEVPADGSEPVILKHRPDSFIGTDLEARLRSAGVRRLIWMGMISWMCVDTTVRAAKALGFENYLVEDACAAGWMRHKGFPVLPWSSHRAFMAALGSHHARLVTAARIGSLESPGTS